MEKDLNTLGIEWYEAKQNGDSAVCKDKQGEIFNMLCEKVISKKFSKHDTNIDEYTEQKITAISNFFVKYFNNFNPEKAKFEHFANKYIKFQKLNEIKATSKHQSRNKSYDIEFEDGRTLKDTFEDENADRQIFDGLNSKAVMIEFLTSLFEINSRLKGRANNADKINYFKMFFTDSVVDITKGQNIIDTLKKRERDIFNNTHISFLDFFMALECRTIIEIFNSSVKFHGEMVDGKPMDKIPKGAFFPADVYKAYFNRIENKTISDSAITQQKDSYKAFLKVNMQYDL